ncbi:type 4a pilus biogenesis protein PilO [Roseisolibacter sp. H3M3-2]|uniref:type 4a pilus biogenesis protein PilO n=1 Tax=Roseisolibacter sp. H3M3-2 TaxID=3031323 RepID=UPI0023DAD002|nr:type 4a pilus biogenesis protein PilO [Roseisolibacter sp. H3M3-2]MDF1505457.1 type 4a pilus biogenesis protein PilO [Roseisolibacter sp. H3M3-2]
MASFLPSDKKDQLKVGVAFLAGALGIYYYLYPYSERSLVLDEQRAHVEHLEETNARAQRELRRGSAKTLREQAAASRATLSVLRQLVPSEHEVPAVLEEVSTAARRAGLELGGVQPEPVMPGDQFDTHRYKVTVVGTYHALTAFLANVGSLPRVVAPVTFALVPAKPKGNQAQRPGDAPPQKLPLEATVTLQTYVTHTAAAPAARTGEVLP